MRLMSAIFLGVVAVGCSSVKNKFDRPESKKWNIILIVADDLGRSDVGCYGNPFTETPQIDRMAAEGIRFTNAYAAAPLCSPTRASIITGTNPARINLTEHLHGYSPPADTQMIAPPRIITGLPANLLTIAEALKQGGYTTAHVGKWHLGSGPSAPAAKGFDIAYGGGQEGMPNTFFYPFFVGQPYKDLLADAKPGDFLDDVLTTKAISVLEQVKDNPIFMQLNFYAPHVPIEGKPALVEKYRDKRMQSGFEGLPQDEYASMVESIDNNVGRVLHFLRQTGMDKNTIVLFTSDNGGLHVQEVPAFAKHTPPTTNAPLRAGKGHLYEGGIREPWIIWSGSKALKPHVATSIVSTDDIFNTAMDLAGLTTKSPDGVSLLPVLAGKALKTRNYYLHFPHYSPQRGKPGAVIRSGKFKLIEWYEDGRYELFDVEKDAGEQNNLAAAFPNLVNELKASLSAWRKQVGAIMPVPNPKYKL